MKIKHINIRNFGQFHNRQFSFSPGLNVVYGENESGKSTLHTFLVSMLFGMEKARGRGAKKDLYTQYEPWNSASFYSGEMDFEVDGKPFHLERNFYHKEKQSVLQNMEDGERLFEEYGDLQMLLGGLTREMYESTHCISQTGVRPGKELAAFVQNSMANAASAGDGNFQVSAAIARLTKKKKQTEKALKEEREKRERQIEKLQIEREILEEDIERQRLILHKDGKDKQKAEDVKWNPLGQFSSKVYLAVLIVGCFLMAGWFLFCALQGISLATALEKGGAICFCTVICSAGFYWAERRRRTAFAGEREPESENALFGELQEKQTRLFNVLESQTELETPTQREEELQQYLSAYDLAGKTIHMLTGEIYEDFGDRINSRTSEILSELTQGRYDRIEIDEKMEVSVYTQNRVLRPQQLSTGTLEQIYFALRMSLGEIFSQEEQMPILLDETFARFDDKRLRQALCWLGRQGRQMILFTCQRREMEYLEELGIPYEKIELEGN